jgi:U3 small nucleolar RNA-associated protein 14
VNKTNRKHTENSPSDSGDESAHDEDVRLPTSLQNEHLVKKAFAGDEVLEDFNKEKLDTIEDEGDKVIEDTLPGWGNWTGSGLTKRERKRAKRTFTTVEGVKPENRRDVKLERVIINEKRVRKVQKPFILFLSPSRILHFRGARDFIVSSR